MIATARRWLRAGLLAALPLALVAGGPSADDGGRTGRVEATVTEGGGSPVEDAVVSLAPLDGAPAGPRPATAVMDQQDKEFVPHVLPVHVGTAVTFPNRDNIRHHVYSFSPAKRFELPLYIGTPAAPVVFDRPGVVALGCNIHDWMLAYIHVLETPYFARTGRDGRARIDGLPPGRYEAQVWHPRLRDGGARTARSMTIAAGEAAPISFAVSLKREWRQPRDPGRYQDVQGG